MLLIILCSLNVVTSTAYRRAGKHYWFFCPVMYIEKQPRSANITIDIMLYAFGERERFDYRAVVIAGHYMDYQA